MYFFATYCYTSRRFGFATLGRINNVNPECSACGSGSLCSQTSRIRIRVHHSLNASGSPSVTGTFHHQVKKKKTLIATGLYLHYDKDEKSRIRFRTRNSMVRISGSGSAPKWHGSTTLQQNVHSTFSRPEATFPFFN